MKHAQPNLRMIAIILTMALAFGMLSGCASNNAASVSDTGAAVEESPSPVPEAMETVPDSGAAPGSSIAIPGFEVLAFQANQTQQSVNFYNPEENACLFRLTLLLDGGETLWSSQDLAPGDSVRKLDLARPLGAGDYTATLNYECFALDGITRLNGAEINVTIQVS